MQEHEPITRQELGAVISAAEKTAEQLSKIAERLAVGNTLNEKIVAMQEKVIAELTNGLPKRISDPVLSHAEKNGVKLEEMSSEMREIKWVMRLVGGLAATIGIGKIVLSLIHP